MLAGSMLWELVDHDTIGKLNSKTIVIDGDVDVILVLDSYFLSRAEMLYL